MGCFSYMCKECGTSVRSSSFDGERCRIYFLKSGVVVEEQRGRYDSYGRTFEDEDWTSGDWNDLCGVMFNDDKTSGFAIVHEACFTGEEPTTISKHDPNQGWDKMRKKFM